MRCSSKIIEMSQAEMIRRKVNGRCQAKGRQIPASVSYLDCRRQWYLPPHTLTPLMPRTPLRPLCPAHHSHTLMSRTPFAPLCPAHHSHPYAPHTHHDHLTTLTTSSYPPDLLIPYLHRLFVLQWRLGGGFSRGWISAEGENGAAPLYGH